MNQHPKKWRSILFPEQPRDFLFRRFSRSLLRTLHILTGGVLVGAYVFSQPPELVHPWLIGAVISGLLLFATDLHASFAIVFEWRGLAIAAKITLLALLPYLPGMEIFILTVVLTIGAISSHLSRKFRHRLWYSGAGLRVDERHG